MSFKVTNGLYKDVKSVVITTDKLQATFLPGEGGKLISLVCLENGKDYLEQRKESTYRHLGPETTYVEASCDSYDDMFPTIDPWEIPDGPLKGAKYLDHGEVSRIPHLFTKYGDAMYTYTRLSNLPVTFEKKITENERGGLRIDFTITNLCDTDIDYIWAAHFMAVAEEGGRVITPFKDGGKAEIVFASDNEKYGSRNDIVTLPYGKDGVTRVDENKKFVPGKGDAWKYYFCDPLPEGWIGYRYPSDGRTLKFRFDEKKVPYGGMWLNDGEFHGISNAAMEIATGTFDRPDSARERNQYSVLKASGKETWYFEIDIEK